MKKKDPKIDKIDDLARQYHKTKNEKLKSLWYEAVKQWANKRRKDETKRSTTNTR
jgi:hypothetical protein